MNSIFYKARIDPAVRPMPEPGWPSILRDRPSRPPLTAAGWILAGRSGGSPADSGVVHEGWSIGGTTRARESGCGRSFGTFGRGGRWYWRLMVGEVGVPECREGRHRRPGGAFDEVVAAAGRVGGAWEA